MKKVKKRQISQDLKNSKQIIRESKTFFRNLKTQGIPQEEVVIKVPVLRKPRNLPSL
jgi:hypothetical protein